MFPEERREKILAILNEQGRCRVAHLAKQLAVSEVTIRMDLDILEKQGLLLRTHGGAILNPKTGYERAYQDEESSFPEEKKGLAGMQRSWSPTGIPLSWMWGRPSWKLRASLSGTRNLP